MCANRCATTRKRASFQEVKHPLLIELKHL